MNKYLLSALNQSLIPRPAAEALPGNLLEIQNIRPHPRPNGAEIFIIKIWILTFSSSDSHACQKFRSIALIYGNGTVLEAEEFNVECDLIPPLETVTVYWGQ